ncbi:hypothetical protein HHX47_DHR3000873 [Lentinula edodes]|nr:hypothetical protein HHX47_DHR3000873 [Lentinula edodes]
MEASYRAELRRQAHQANTRASTDKLHIQEDFRNIYNWFDFAPATLTEGLSSEESKLAAKPPPPELMMLVVRNMIYPNILSAYIPDLLEVLSNIEKWRARANGRAGRALACDGYWPHYHKQYPSGLTDSDRKVLQVISDAHEVTRTKYVEILKQYCNLVTYQVETTEIFQSHVLGFSTYLTPDELVKLWEVRKEWADFVAECMASGYSAQPHVRVPNQEQIVAQTEAYLVLVQKEVDALERIFNEDAYKYRVG